MMSADEGGDNKPTEGAEPITIRVRDQVRLKKKTGWVVAEVSL